MQQYPKLMRLCYGYLVCLSMMHCTTLSQSAISSHTRGGEASDDELSTITVVAARTVRDVPGAIGHLNGARHWSVTTTAAVFEKQGPWEI